MKLIVGTPKALSKITDERKKMLPKEYKLAPTEWVYMNMHYGNWTLDECDDVIYIVDEETIKKNNELNWIIKFEI